MYHLTGSRQAGYCTVRAMTVDFETVPEVAVTVTWEVPVGVGTGVEALLLPPHPATAALRASPSNRMGSMARKRRLLVAPNSRKPANGVIAASAMPNPR